VAPIPYVAAFVGRGTDSERATRLLIALMVLHCRAARDRFDGRGVGPTINYRLKPHWSCVTSNAGPNGVAQLYER
jgi:hypothetical protein